MRGFSIIDKTCFSDSFVLQDRIHLLLLSLLGHLKSLKLPLQWVAVPQGEGEYQERLLVEGHQILRECTSISTSLIDAMLTVPSNYHLMSVRRSMN